MGLSTLPFWERPIFVWLFRITFLILLIYAITITVLFINTDNKYHKVGKEPTCDVDYTYSPKTGYCYKPTVVSYHYENATSSCNSENAHLASIHSEEENVWLMNLYYSTLIKYQEKVDLFIKRTFVWIGLVADPVTKVWSWTDGSSIDYTYWAIGEPNNMDREYWVWIFDTMEAGYSPDGRMWNNVVITGDGKIAAFVCKKSPNP